MSDNKNLKVVELREIARSRGLRGWYRLRKSELISFITSEEQRQREVEELERQRQREEEELERQRQQEEERRNDPVLIAQQRRQKRVEDVTAKAKAKAEKKIKSKARRLAKREEVKREAERRAEVKRVESNQRRQRAENITGERPSDKETKSQRKHRQRLERQAKQTETQRKAHERAQKKDPKKKRKEAKRKHRATKKEARRKLSILQQRRLTEPAQAELVSNAIEGNVQRWFVSGEGYTIPSVFLDHIGDGVREVVDRVGGSKKVYTVLKCVLVKHNLKTKEKIFTEFNGSSETHTITTQLGDTYEEMKGKMLESLAKYQKEGSGWQLHRIVGLDISVVKFNPLSGSGYSKGTAHC